MCAPQYERSRLYIVHVRILFCIQTSLEMHLGSRNRLVLSPIIRQYNSFLFHSPDGYGFSCDGTIMRQFYNLFLEPTCNREKVLYWEMCSCIIGLTPAAAAGCRWKRKASIQSPAAGVKKKLPSLSSKADTNYRGNISRFFKKENEINFVIQIGYLISKAHKLHKLQN